MTGEPTIPDKTKVVIFDVDGTLYHQPKLRKRMLRALLAYYALRPWRVKEVLILHHFRAEREKRSGSACSSLEDGQYAWCAQKGNYPLDKVRQVVGYWMFRFPNQYLQACLYPGISTLFDTLRNHNIKIAIYSDYKAHDKLKAMNLQADLVVSSTDPEVDRLKPDPKGLLYITGKLQVDPSECLFIGDRQELDGESAIRANMPYLIVDRKPLGKFDFYQKMAVALNSRLRVKSAL
ncbi:HAD family hydrolase [Pontibacter pamirensis]|uniref:HAD family hydrolase n=1 Tax=Pontibacter pamirensis TaxID=2562824 RepID=UPI00138A3E81|nr:HAD family hydrolase [Pontibacter pamirensis]